MKTPSKAKPGARKPKRVTLKTIAEHLNLTPGTVSAALNKFGGGALDSGAHEAKDPRGCARAELPA